MPREEEREFLAPWAELARTGNMLVVSPLRAALSQKLGRTVRASVVYRLLERHGWRKVGSRHAAPADTVGVFQIESRAQMSMLPRLKPKTFYDLVVEVAIVRPGPIQGGMVHPYLRRRQGKDPVTYPSEGIEAILGNTLGIPLFQEQVMELVIHAGYSPSQADGLRRSMAAWKRGGDMEPHRVRISDLMEGKGYSSDFIDQIFEQIKGFGSYGFPQSHAASFAKLVYISCGLKRHEPAAFACALLNAQPMGYYSAGQIVQDARRGKGGRVGIDILPVGAAQRLGQHAGRRMANAGGAKDKPASASFAKQEMRIQDSAAAYLPVPQKGPATPTVGYGDLPASVRQSMPALAINGFASGDGGAAMVVVDDKLLREGDEAAPGVRVERIFPEGVEYSATKAIVSVVECCDATLVLTT